MSTIEWITDSWCFLKSGSAELIGRHCSGILDDVTAVNCRRTEIFHQNHWLMKNGTLSAREIQKFYARGSVPNSSPAILFWEADCALALFSRNASECDASEATSRTVTHWDAGWQSISSRVVQIKPTPLIILFRLRKVQTAWMRHQTCMHLTPLVDLRNHALSCDIQH